MSRLSELKREDNLNFPELSAEERARVIALVKQVHSGKTEDMDRGLAGLVRFTAEIKAKSVLAEVEPLLERMCSPPFEDMFPETQIALAETQLSFHSGMLS